MLKIHTAEPNTPRRDLRFVWGLICLIVAAACFVPVAYVTEKRVAEVTRQARERLIIQHRLWELDPAYPGTPQAWTRFASRLLTDNQLMRRVRARYGELAREIELDYRRDLTVAQAEVVAIAAVVWMLPLAALYGLGILYLRRSARREPPKPPAKTPASDSRYRP